MLFFTFASYQIRLIMSFLYPNVKSQLRKYLIYLKVPGLKLGYDDPRLGMGINHWWHNGWKIIVHTGVSGKERLLSSNTEFQIFSKIWKRTTIILGLPNFKIVDCHQSNFARETDVKGVHLCKIFEKLIFFLTFFASLRYD